MELETMVIESISQQRWQ